MNYQERYDLYTKLKSSIDSEERDLNNRLDCLNKDENNLKNNISSKRNDLYYKNQELSNLERKLSDLERDYAEKKKDYDTKKKQIEKEEEKIKENRKEINNLNAQLKEQKAQIDQLNTEIENSNKKTEILNKNLSDIMKESKLQMQYMEQLQIKIMDVMKKHRERPEERLAQKTLAKEFICDLHGEEEYNKALRISEALFSGNLKSLTSEEREKSLNDMITLALDSIL